MCPTASLSGRRAEPASEPGTAVSDRYLVKVIPPHGYSVYRLEFTRRRLYVGLAALVAALFVVFGYILWDVQRLRALAEQQRRQLVAVDRQATSLNVELQRIQRQNAEIRRMVGLKPETPHPLPRQLAYRGGSETLQMRLAALRHLVGSIDADQSLLAQQTRRVIDERKAEAAARARALAAIPSTMPVEGPIDSGFGYRSYPDREFHEGVDIAADYGAPVQATADGYVASAGWDGGYGIKVDIDHGNGYHSWYAHLSKALVHEGQAVKRGQEIGLVGATGFATGPHLHYQLMLDGRAIDPTPFLHGAPADVIASSR